MDPRYFRPAPQEPRVRGIVWPLIFGALALYNLVVGLFPSNEVELIYWWGYLLSALIFLGLALLFVYFRRKDLAAHREWEAELAAWRQEQIELTNRRHAEEMERINRQLELERTQLARIRAQSDAAQPEAARSDGQIEEYAVSGVSRRQDVILAHATENDDYTLSKQQIIDLGMEDEKIYQYGGERLCATLEREPNNPHDPNAVRVLMVGDFIGYIPADASAHVAALLDHGAITDVRARIVGGPCKYYDSEEGCIVKEQLHLGVRLTIYLQEVVQH